MKKLISLAAVAAISMGQVAAVHALDLTAAVGRTGESTTTYRLGAQFDCAAHFLRDPDVLRQTLAIRPEIRLQP